MRLALIVHGFPPLERAGVENHCAALAKALCARGHTVEVLAPRIDPERPEGSLVREEVDGYGITWVHWSRGTDDPEREFDRPHAREAFGEFLDQARPDVLHFHQLSKLGWSLAEDARKRNLPTVFTAHDYAAICGVPTLQRPDLSPLPIAPPPEELARCDLARSFLNGIERLGDYQVGVHAHQLEPHERQQLEDILHGEPSAEGELGGQLADCVHVRRELEERRRKVMETFDAVLAPSQTMLDALVAHGVDEARIELVPYGIETSALSQLTPPKPRRAAPICFGFIGSMSKHKGPHILLDALARLRRSCRARLYGDSTDRVYVESLRVKAERLGAEWHGAFDAEDLPRIMETIDVLVVPSMWLENAPFVIREAFAAHRPVLASRTPALAECVRDRIDGLLFDPGNSLALAQQMRRLSTRPQELGTMIGAVRPPQDLAKHVEALETVYASCLAAHDPSGAEASASGETADADGAGSGAESNSGDAETTSGGGPSEDGTARAGGAGEPAGADDLDDEVEQGTPAHLTPFEERYDRYAKQSSGALLEMARKRLERVRRELELDADESWLTDATEAFLTRQRERHRLLTTETEWLRASQIEANEAQEALEKELDWLRTRVTSLEEESAWLREGHEEDEKAKKELQERIATAEKELEWRRKVTAETEKECEWLREKADKATEELDWLREAKESLEEEGKWLRDLRIQLEEELEWLRSEQANWKPELTAALETELGAITECLEGLGARSRWLKESEAREIEEARPGELPERLSASRLRIAELRAELEWRRAEMRSAPADGGAVFRRMLDRSALGRRLQTWNREDSDG